MRRLQAALFSLRTTASIRPTGGVRADVLGRIRGPYQLAVADRKKYNTMRRSFCALAAVLVLGLTAADARSDEIDDATDLLRKGAASEASAQIDKFLKIDPKDARGRFLEGVIGKLSPRSTTAHEKLKLIDKLLAPARE